MFAAFFASLLAGNCAERSSCVDCQSLLYFVGTESEFDVEKELTVVVHVEWLSELVSTTRRGDLCEE